jgi:hypothetical protein
MFYERLLDVIASSVKGRVVRSGGICTSSTVPATGQGVSSPSALIALQCVTSPRRAAYPVGSNDHSIGEEGAARFLLRGHAVIWASPRASVKSTVAEIGSAPLTKRVTNVRFQERVLLPASTS